MNESTEKSPSILCPTCRGPAEQVHIQGFSGEASLYRGPTGSLLGSLAESGMLSGRRACSASGEELALGYMEDGVHCPACKMVVFRYAV